MEHLEGGRAGGGRLGVRTAGRSNCDDREGREEDQQ